MGPISGFGLARIWSHFLPGGPVFYLAFNLVANLAELGESLFL